MATCKNCIHYLVCNLKGAGCRDENGVFGNETITMIQSVEVERNCEEYLPSDVAPVKHGHWEVSFLRRSYYGSDHDYEYTECECSVTCSNCHGIASCFPWKKQEDSTGFIKAYQKGMIKNAKTNYCPNCGAKMDGGD